MDGLRKRTVVVRCEGSVKAAVCCRAGDEAAVCSRAEIRDDRWQWRRDGLYGDRRVRESEGTKNC
jgi:hypothetical protein